MRAFFALALLGCGGAGAHGSTIPSAVDVGGVSVSALLPSDTFSLMYVDLASARETRLYRAMDESVSAWSAAFARMEVEGEDEQAEEEADVWSILSRADWFVSAQAGPPSNAEEILLIGGRMQPAEVERLLRWTAESSLDDVPVIGDLTGMGDDEPLDMSALAEPTPDPPAPAPIEIGSATIAGRQATTAGDLAAVKVVENVWVVAPRSRIEDIVGRAERAPAPDARTRELEEALSIYSYHAAIVLADLSEITEALPTEEDGETGWLRQLEAAAIRFDLSDGLEAVALVESASAIGAQRARRELEGAIADARETSFVQLFGLGSVLERVTAVSDGSRVRLELSLDEVEAHLLWGRLSGGVGAALFVVELFSSAFSGLSDALGELGEGLADLTPRVVDVRVVEATAGAPVGRDAQCSVAVESAQPGLCAVEVTCAGATLYEAEGSCELGGSDTRSVTMSDASTSSASGDPALYLDTPAGLFELRDDASGPHGEYTIRGTITAVH